MIFTALAEGGSIRSLITNQGTQTYGLGNTCKKTQYESTIGAVGGRVHWQRSERGGLARAGGRCQGGDMGLWCGDPMA